MRFVVVVLLLSSVSTRTAAAVESRTLIGTGFRFADYWVGDFTGDSIADLLTRNNAGELYLYQWLGDHWGFNGIIGTGFGTFTDVLVADFTGDGIADLLVRDSSGALFVYEWLGTRWGRTRSLTAGINYTHYWVGEFTGDRIADLMLRDADGNLYLWPAPWQQQTSPRMVGNGWNFEHYLVGDFTGDGIADLMTSRSGDLRLYEWLGDRWGPRSGLVETGLNLDDPKVADFTGDGIADLLFRSRAGELSLYEWLGTRWGRRGVVAAGVNYTHAWSADFTGDGRADVIVRDDDGNLYLHRWSAPDQQIAAGLIGNGWNFDQYLVGDFTGDGIADLMGTKGGDLRLYEWLGDRFGMRTGLVRTGMAFSHLLAADFTGDRIVDVVARDSSGDLNLYEWLGSRWGLTGRIGTGWQFTDYWAADFTGDGIADLLVRNGAGELYLYEWLGNRWGFNGIVGTLKNFTHVLIADFTGDGIADLLVHNAAGELELWQWLGARWGTRRIVATGLTDVTDLLAADFTGDRIADLVVRNGAGAMYLYEWLGDRWGRGATIASKFEYTHYFAADFTGDGIADLVVRDRDGNLYLYKLNYSGLPEILPLTLSATGSSGTYNIAQQVAFTANRSAAIFYTVDGSVPSPNNGQLYAGPLTIDRDTFVKAIAVDGPIQSRVVSLRIRILDVPTSTVNGTFATVHERPILQNITRTRFWSTRASPSGDIHFSTLESYGRDAGQDRFVLYKYNPQSGALSSRVVPGSVEARSRTYSTRFGKYLLGTSLNPQVLTYDPVTQQTETLFSTQEVAWVHKLATAGDYVYAMLSASKLAHQELKGILKIHIPSKSWSVIPFTDTMEQDWGGIQGIDPTGRIWFYRAYPLTMKWYDEAAGMKTRTVTGYEDRTVETWDTWGDDFFVILTDSSGAFIKRRVDAVSLQVTTGTGAVDSAFLESIPLDFYHQGDEPLRSLYFNSRTQEFSRVDNAARVLKPLGKANLGEFKLVGSSGSLMEPQWENAELGIIDVLGYIQDCPQPSTCTTSLVVWLVGQKGYGFVPLNPTAALPLGPAGINVIKALNLSAADILTLAVGRDRRLYGSGYLTISDIFRFDPGTDGLSLLEQAIPFAEGEVNGLFTGFDGMIYGVGYPDSIIFKYDPRLPWVPGSKPTSNPVNVGRMGHHNQTVSYRGLQDLDGNIWFQSRGEYAYPITYALAKVNFTDRAMQVKTDIDDGFPVVDDFTIYDGTRLLLLGHEGNTFKLYLLNQRDFAIERQVVLGKDDGILVNFDPRNSSGEWLFLAKRDVLYRVRRDLSLQPVHRARGDIKKIVAGDGKAIILMGQTFVERINSGRGDWEVWWDSKAEPVFRNLPYVPAVFHDGLLYIGDRDKLRVLRPPS